MPFALFSMKLTAFQNMAAGRHDLVFPPNPVCDQTGAFDDAELAAVRQALGPSFLQQVFHGVVPEPAEKDVSQDFGEGSVWVDSSRAALGAANEDDDEDSRQVPAIVYLHAGGGVAGSAQAQAGIAFSISRYTGYPVLSLEYPLMPEHTLEDAGRAAKEAVEKLQQRGHARVSLMAGSAGCAVALKALQLGAQPASTVLVSPKTWHELGLPSHKTNDAYESFSAETIGCMWKLWRMEGTLFDADWSKYGPIYITAGEKELFVDDAREAGKKLQGSGYTLGEDYELEVVPNVPHMFSFMIGWFPEAHESLTKIADWIKQKNTE